MYEFPSTPSFVYASLCKDMIDDYRSKRDSWVRGQCSVQCILVGSCIANRES